VRIYFRFGPRRTARTEKNAGAGTQGSHHLEEVPVTTFVDKSLTCRDCGIEFQFTAGEQEFYQTKGLINEPGRCPECRALRREGRAVTRARSMHEVTCAVCGTVTEVPFLPTQGRPVYCQDCFQQIRARN
jgi:CxxC-x17-CxxC domain-containing protein